MAKAKIPIGTSDGKFRSIPERIVAEHLASLGVPVMYEEDRIEYTVDRTYTPDFKLPNGIYIEVKGGFFLSKDRRKMVLVKKQHPELDIRFVFQKGRLKVKGQQSKVTNEQWCIKNGFLYAEGTIPEAWISEREPSSSVNPVPTVRRGRA